MMHGFPIKAAVRKLSICLCAVSSGFMVGCVGGGKPWTPPPVIAQDEYTFELVRLDGQDPGLGQFTDIKYLGDSQYLVAGSHGFITIAPDGEHGYRVVDTTAFSRPPEKSFGGQAMSLVDLDADGRYEAITDPNVMAARVILYDDDGAYLWDHTTPPGTSVWGIDYVAPVQADLDPELEIFFCYKNTGSARLIQFDGTMGPELMPSYHMPGLLEVFPVDVDGDGIDELICGPDKEVALWSFEKGLLAEVDLKIGRVTDLRLPTKRSSEEGYEFEIWRLNKRTRPGWSNLSLNDADGTWKFQVTEFQRFNDNPHRFADYRSRESLVNEVEGLWIGWNRLARPRPGDGKYVYTCQIMIGSSKYGLIFRDYLYLDFYPVISEGAGARNTDSPAVMEAWFVFVNGVWRLRIERNAQETGLP